mgnify:CR=1 FL=1
MKYLLLFMTFAKIGMFTIGGGYAMIPLIEREIVKKRWMSKEDFMEMFALTQSLPGVFAVNISIFVGYKLHKVKGSLVCALATILPSFVIMMLIAMFFAHFQDNQVMIRIFNGIRPGSSRTDCDTLHFGCTGTEAEVLATGASSHRHHTHLAIRAIPRIHCPCRNCRRNALYIMVKR